MTGMRPMESNDRPVSNRGMRFEPGRTDAGQVDREKVLTTKEKKRMLDIGRIPPLILFRHSDRNSYLTW
jgi:hypothetical protein